MRYFTLKETWSLLVEVGLRKVAVVLLSSCERGMCEMGGNLYLQVWWVKLITQVAGSCLKCVCVCVSWVRLSAFTWCVSCTESHTSKHKICFMLKSFPNISVFSNPFFSSFTEVPLKNENCICLRCAMWCLEIRLYCEMIYHNDVNWHIHHLT